MINNNQHTLIARLAVLAVTIASIVTVVSNHFTFDLSSTIIGLILLVILFAYAGNTNWSRLEYMAFCAVASLSILITIGFLINPIYHILNLGAPHISIGSAFLYLSLDLFTFLIWLSTALILLRSQPKIHTLFRSIAAR